MVNVNINKDNSICKKMIITATEKQKRITIPGVFEDNGLPDLSGKEIELCMDRENKIVYFQY